MSSIDEEIVRLYRVRKTIMQMLNDRGYSVTDDEINMTRHQFDELYGVNRNKENLLICKEMRNNSSEKICVFFVASDSAKLTGTAHVRRCMETMMSKSVFRAILVVMTKLSSYAAKSFSEYPRFIIEVFHESELVVNVLDHMFVPKHQVLTDEEKKELLDKYRVKDTQLPRMLTTDPVTRYFGLQRGKIVKIIRPSETAGKYVTYRIVY
ncbi:hypothetical protein vseg_009457 [Gypsophila vaccaria]